MPFKCLEKVTYLFFFHFYNRSKPLSLTIVIYLRHLSFPAQKSFRMHKGPIFSFDTKTQKTQRSLCHHYTTFEKKNAETLNCADDSLFCPISHLLFCEAPLKVARNLSLRVNLVYFPGGREIVIREIPSFFRLLPI